MTSRNVTKSAGQSAKKADGDAAVREKIAAMPEPFRGMGERIHALIMRTAPALEPRTWYGMPGYAKDGTTVCFFRADKRYMTFGFTQEAELAPAPGAADQLIDCAWFLTSLNDATEARISAILREALKGEG